MRLTLLTAGLTFSLACGSTLTPEVLGSGAQALLVNQETGEGYHPTLDEDGNLEDPPDWVVHDAQPYHPSGGQTATLHGRVFFNDRRRNGLFSARKTVGGSPGTRCTPEGKRNDGSSCSLNLLGAQYMVVDVIERDEGYFAPTAWDCKNRDVLQSVPVNADGSFTATFAVGDDCDSDALQKMAIVLEVRTRYCGEWCFSVSDKNGKPYVLTYPGATVSSPLLVDPGDEVNLSDMVFNPGGTSQTVANDTSIAANYYAALVDTVLTLHRDEGIPFYSSYGEAVVEYPSTATGSATTLSANRIAIADVDNWINGDVVAHEYGHLVNLRAWGGDYGWDGVGNGGVSWNASDATEPRIAFKEGWANFVARAVFRETMAYDLASFDDNATTPALGTFGQGYKFVTNVNKMLSDWYDTRNDDDTSRAGAGDHFAADDLYSVWFNLRRMYLDVGLYGGDFEGGLTVCDYVHYYLDVRKSAAKVGTTAHNDYVSWVTDLIYNNNLACYLPSP